MVPVGWSRPCVDEKPWYPKFTIWYILKKKNNDINKFIEVSKRARLLTENFVCQILKRNIVSNISICYQKRRLFDFSSDRSFALQNPIFNSRFSLLGFSILDTINTKLVS